MATVPRMMTHEDLLAVPDDGNRYELVRGEILRMPPPQGRHPSIEARLVEAIGRYLYERARALGWEESQGYDARDALVGRVDSGEAGVRFALPDDPDQTRGMDVCYLNPEQVARHRASGPDAYMREVPALAVEVISPSESASYVQEKVDDHLAGGAQLVWLLFPRRRVVQVHSPDHTMIAVTANDLLEGDEVPPGFAVPVDTLFG